MLVQPAISDCFNTRYMYNNTTPGPSPRIRKVKGRVEINIQQCKGCSLCITECKEHALTLSQEINKKGYRYAIAHNELCTGCVNCALVCPDAVISVYRTKVQKTSPASPQNIEQP